MQILRHLVRSPFVAATGAAAFVHSTWALAIIFGGEHPTISDWQSFAAWFAWAAPAMLIAFALDVGQINTSIQIAELHAIGRRPYAKYMAFGTFAAATYLLQWFHLIHHFPNMPYSPGINVTPFIEALRTAMIWIVPALLPISTILYTFSHSAPNDERKPAPPVVQQPSLLVQPIPANLDAMMELKPGEQEYFLETTPPQPSAVGQNGHAAKRSASGASRRSPKNRGNPDSSAQSDVE